MSGQFRSRPETLGQVSGRPGSGSLRSGPPLATGQLVREWEISELRGHGLEKVVVDSGMQIEGLVHRVHDFPGGAFNDGPILRPDRSLLPPDGIATGQITSFADGITYWVSTEAPQFADHTGRLLVGSRCWLRQTQSFSKLAADASLSFTITSAFIETTDMNSPDRGCPPEVGDDGPFTFCDVLKGELNLDVHAFTVPADDPTDPGSPVFGTFFRVAGSATGGGFQGHWLSRIGTDGTSRLPLWDEAPRSAAGSGTDFDFILDAAIVDHPHSGPESRWLIDLREPLTFTVDLSSLDIGQAFTLQTVAVATAYNRIHLYPTPLIEFESSARAGLMDPLGIGGTEITFSGLEPIEVPGISFGQGGIVLTDSPVEPAPCPPESVIDAGSLQFSADHYTMTESNPTPVITVLRSGGTTGAVTATITTSDGTALAGTDYTPVHASVFFANGDNTPRAVVVPVLPNEVGVQADRTVSITLSDPGGCATLGSPSTTELTIRDDDPAPPVVQNYALDPTFGVGGKTSTTLGGTSVSAAAVQADGKIVMVGGGRFSAFVLARFDVDGALDDSFGEGGIVLTDIAGGFGSEQARGVAIQPNDQKIVVVGDTPAEVFSDLCVLRYEADGRLDETFGTGGIFTSQGPGTAKDVVLQPDGRILVAGSAQSGFFLARLLSDGQLDPSFGLAGMVAIEGGGRGNFAENVVIQPDGRIVLSGWSNKPDNQFDQVTDLARYQSDGQLDSTFGTVGTVTLDANVGADLIVQPDGRLLLVGASDHVPVPGGQQATAIAVMRLEPDGTVDDTFGDEGVSLISVTEHSEVGGVGTALALQPDGRILVAGATNGVGQDFLAARLHSDGRPDTEFADTGVMAINFFRSSDRAASITPTGDNKILVSGFVTSDDFRSGWGVARISQQTGDPPVRRGAADPTTP